MIKVSGYGVRGEPVEVILENGVLTGDPGTVEAIHELIRTGEPIYHNIATPIADPPSLDEPWAFVVTACHVLYRPVWSGDEAPIALLGADPDVIV